MAAKPRKAPSWFVERWFNTPAPLTPEMLAGKVVVLHAFQMLCPGCVRLGLPQARKIHDLFPRDLVAVVGLHTVFEQHAAQAPAALEAFIQENHLTFPIGVDRPGAGGLLPQTMAAYALQGTPSLVLIDRQGFVRKHRFGAEDDMTIGADIAFLLAERPPVAAEAPADGGDRASGGCPVPAAARPRET